jgi:serine phosphatase RsbU (regulator of sigma subunit)
MFASAFYLIADVENGRLSYANAGHPSPIVLSASDEADAPSDSSNKAQWLLQRDFVSGPALGVFEDAVYETASRELSVGDLILLFTDGLVEVEGQAGQGEWGEDHLLQSVQQNRQMAPSLLFDQILSEIRQFSGQPEFEDDVCLIGMQVDHLHQRER